MRSAIATCLAGNVAVWIEYHISIVFPLSVPICLEPSYNTPDFHELHSFVAYDSDGTATLAELSRPIAWMAMHACMALTGNKASMEACM